MAQGIEICPWSLRDEADCIAFLASYAETSLFLLSNLKEYGPTLGASPYSGNFKVIKREGKVAGVFCVTRSGNLLLQTDRYEDYADFILEACQREEVKIIGCIADLSLTESFWSHLLASNPAYQTTLRSNQILYGLTLSSNLMAQADLGVRFLTEQDDLLWEPLIEIYQKELNLPRCESRQETLNVFKEGARQNHWWGLFEGDTLISMASYNACVHNIAQIGGVFTHPAYRQQGYAKRVMIQLIRDSYSKHKIEKLILFTEENNSKAQGLYEDLGFGKIGSIGLFFAEIT